jgi:hypothetical protein
MHVCFAACHIIHADCALAWLLQWFLEHDSTGSKRDKPYSPNLLATSAPDVLVGYLQWLEAGLPGYEGRQVTADKLVGGSNRRCSS